MVTVRKLWLLLPPSVRNFPADLSAVAGLVGATWVVLLVPALRGTLLRAVVGALLVVVVPGYAFTAVLFPESAQSESGQSGANAREASERQRHVMERESGVNERASDASERGSGTGERGTLFPRPGEGIGLVERLVFSVGLSVTTVPLVGLLLNFTPWGVGRRATLLSVSGLALALVAVAAVRRWRRPPDDRFRLPYRRWYESVRTELLEPTTEFDAVLNAILVLSVLVATGSVAYAVAGPGQDQSFTEFYVVTENETGALVADDYPTTIRRGQTESVVVGVGNHENQPMRYTVVVQLQRVRANGTAGAGDAATTRIVEARRLGVFQTRAGANATVVHTQRIDPTMTGERLRVQFLLYEGNPPPNPRPSNAYRKAHFWTNVTTA